MLLIHYNNNTTWVWGEIPSDNKFKSIMTLMHNVPYKLENISVYNMPKANGINNLDEEKYLLNISTGRGL